MRILLVGQAAFAEEVVRGLEAAGDTIAAVVCPPDAGPKPDPVKAAALARGVPLHQFRSLKAPEARHAFAEARGARGAGRHRGEPLLPDALPARRAHGAGCGRARPRGQGAAPPAGRVARELRSALPRRARPDRLEPPRSRGPQPDPWLRPSARRAHRLA